MHILYIGSVLLPIDKLGRKGEQFMKTGFTLIELLVVVLIIGILAAIALPQYQKAVERSRMAEAVQVLGDAATAQSLYYMQNGRFATTLDLLNTNGDIQINNPGTSWSEITFGASKFLSQHGAGQPMTLSRVGGMYDGNSLQLTIYADGFMTKYYTWMVGDGFNVLAESHGYQEETFR